MHKILKSGIILTLLLVLAAASASGITRVSRSLNVIDFYGGYATPWGKYEGTISRNFMVDNRPVDVDAEDVYEPTFFIGFDYGSLRRGHLLYQLGFRYYNHRMIDTVQLPSNYISYFGIDYSLRQYDIDFNFNYLINDLNFKPWSPYLGLGFHAGITSLGAKGYDSENEIELALSLNYGLDLRIWKKRDNESFITLSSINNFNFWASEDRPKYFNFGLGLKYFFEM
ncbi:MAG: hypothetical protein JXA92_07835 [candidate division Zixibacteria bacterium]|nr:hypothetical protein [candidate division Zixibacteria bacterium]